MTIGKLTGHIATSDQKHPNIWNEDEKEKIYQGKTNELWWNFRLMISVTSHVTSQKGVTDSVTGVKTQSSTEFDASLHFAYFSTKVYRRSSFSQLLFLTPFLFT